MSRAFVVAIVILFAPAYTLGETDTIICNYPTYSDQTGNHKVKKEFVLTFIIDTSSKKAYMPGNLGSTKVLLIPQQIPNNGISFIEVTASGNVMTTAIDSKGNSIHSRNEIIDGKIVPTQYYGKCVFK